MAHDYTEVQTAFLEGTEEVFTELFTDLVELHYLDEENTEVNDLYGEAINKVYKDYDNIVAKVDLVREQGDRPPEAVGTTATVKIPTNVLIKLGIPHTQLKALRVLEKSRISYKGNVFEVKEAKPTTPVGDCYIFHTLFCVEVKSGADSNGESNF